MKTGYYACLSKQLFSIGHLGMEVFEVLPINTPIKIHQIITVEDDGREVISDGDDLIQSKLSKDNTLYVTPLVNIGAAGNKL